MDTWIDEEVVAPCRELLARLAIGEELRDLDRAREIGVGVDGIVRGEVDAHYPPWPRGSTTDGFIVDVCQRTSADTLELIGMAWIDFGGLKFPLRALVRLTPDHAQLDRVTIEIGEAGRATGEPPRLSRDTMILPARDEHGTYLHPELLVGRHPRRIRWVKAIDYRPPTART